MFVAKERLHFSFLVKLAFKSSVFVRTPFKSFILFLSRENVKLAFGSFVFHFEKEGSTHGGVKKSRFHCRGVLSPLSGQKIKA